MVKEINTRDYGVLFSWTPDGFAPLASKVIRIDIPRAEAVRGRSLGLRLHSTEAVIDCRKAGLTVSSFERWGDAIEISPSRLAVITNIAARTLARRKKEGKLHLAESERVFRLATLFDRAVEVLGDPDHARRWIKPPTKTLGWKSPLEYADTEIGAREVEEVGDNRAVADREERFRVIVGQGRQPDARAGGQDYCLKILIPAS